jgi:hypothetical protein
MFPILPILEQVKFKVLKNVFKQGVVLYAYNPGTGEEG